MVDSSAPAPNAPDGVDGDHLAPRSEDLGAGGRDHCPTFAEHPVGHKPWYADGRDGYGRGHLTPETRRG
jgi:hypothetical protein